MSKKNDNSIVLFNEFGGVLGLENERFYVLGIFILAFSSANFEGKSASVPIGFISLRLVLGKQTAVN